MLGRGLLLASPCNGQALVSAPRSAPACTSGGTSCSSSRHPLQQPRSGRRHARGVAPPPAASTATVEVGGLMASAQLLDEAEASTFCGSEGEQ